MYCEHCGNAISSESQFCNHCGKPIQMNDIDDNKQKSKVGLILALFAILCLTVAIVIAVMGMNSEKPRNPSSTLGANSNSNSASTDKHTNGEGTYKVGTDIEAGEYFVYCTNNISCYFEVSSDSTGSLTSIVANDNTDTFAFVTVKAGQYLKVNGGQFKKASDATVPGANAEGKYGAGMYRVGIDIPAGEYKVTNTSNYGCYIEVSKDSTGALYSIVSNDNIDTFAYITVSEGQYLTVNRGEFAPA